jgi:carbon monoxide dehydrogenase subunit G
MEITNRFTVPLPPDRTWAALLDVPRIAPCMPGARLTGADAEARSYDGEVQVRLGPIMLAFKGTARLTEVDDAAHRATMVAEGRDKKGRGAASADVAFHLTPVDAGTEVTIVSQIALTGSIAQYGRGSGMIADLADHLVGQFAQNLRAELATEPAPAPASAPEPDAGASAAADAPAQAAADDPAVRQAPAAPAPRPAAAPPQPKAISGFRLGVWLLWKQVCRVFGR